jgi:hypothetical protein
MGWDIEIEDSSSSPKGERSMSLNASKRATRDDAVQTEAKGSSLTRDGRRLLVSQKPFECATLGRTFRGV